MLKIIFYVYIFKLHVVKLFIGVGARSWHDSYIL